MNKNEGSVLVLSLIITMVLSILLMTLTTRILVQRRQIDYSYHQEKTFALAESGIEVALACLSEKNLSEPYPTISGAIPGMGTFLVEITGSTTAIIITSTGSVHHISTNTKRKIALQAVNLGEFIFDAAIVGIDEVTISGGGHVWGDVMVGFGGTPPATADVTGNIKVTDSEIELPEVTPPSSPFDHDHAGTTLGPGIISESGTYRYGDIKVDGLLEITATDAPVIIYVEGNVNLNGEIRISSGCSVSLHVEGNINLAGQGIANKGGDPTNFILYGAGKCDFTGSEIFYGVVYAPEINIEVSGGGAVYGSLVGNTVKVTGGGEVHYDPRVGGLSIPSLENFLFIHGSWKEISVS